jgi:endonuclease V-like protein UPF0215 family
VTITNSDDEINARQKNQEIINNAIGIILEYYIGETIAVVLLESIHMSGFNIKCDPHCL